MSRSLPGNRPTKNGKGTMATGDAVMLLKNGKDIRTFCGNDWMTMMNPHNKTSETLEKRGLSTVSFWDARTV